MIRRTRVRAWTLAVLATLAVPATLPAAATERVSVVFAAPGYPGTTAQAAETMTGWAEAVTAFSGVETSAAYHETDEGAVAAIRGGARLAVVTFPFWLAHGQALDLRPALRAAPVGVGPTERWALVAARGRIATPADLAGWDVASIAGFAPGFVRGVALSHWGPLPGDAVVVSTARVLGALRRAARGERVAVLLDGAQAGGLDRLPFAGDLEIVTRSSPMPASLVCTVGAPAPDGPVPRVLEGLIDLASDPAGARALESIRVERFEPLPGDVDLAAWLESASNAAEVR